MAEANQLLVASANTYATPADALGMPDSRERQALISVTYNRGVGAMRGRALLDAIDNGDRAEAWYQLRHNCWGPNTQYEAGLRKRRFVEAQVLGLYDDPANAGAEEALLQGGQGMDVFLLEDGAGLRDTDGQGMQFWNGRALTGSADAGLMYRLQDGSRLFTH